MNQRIGEGGSATVEFVWLSLLLLMPFVYLMLAVFDVQRSAFGVTAASRAAARAYVLAPEERGAETRGAEWRARQAADVVLGDHRISGARLTFHCEPVCLVPGSTVRVDVRASVPLPLTPAFFGDQLGSIRVEGSHTEPFGQFRAERGP